MFSLCGGLGTYDPCRRLGVFKEALSHRICNGPESLAMELFLRENTMSITSMVDIVGGSESSVYDPNLLDLVNRLVTDLRSACRDGSTVVAIHR